MEAPQPVEQPQVQQQVNGESAPPLPPPISQHVEQPQPLAPVQNASLYVGDLHTDCTEAQLYEIFNAIGPVVSVKVCRDAVTRRSLGYAYVNFHMASDAEKAIESFNFTKIKGKPCRIMWSQRNPALRKTGEGNVFVKNLDVSIDNKALYDTFSLFGNILSCKVNTDATGGSRGYGFVHYETKEAAEEAISKINGMLIAGKEVYVGKFLKKHDRPGPKEWTNIYVKNLPKSWKNDELRSAFTEFGEVASAVIMTDETGQSKGFGFVDFADHQSAQASVSGMDGRDVRDEETKKAQEAEKTTEEAVGEEDKAAEENAEPVEQDIEGILKVCKAQSKTERGRELARKFEELKIEKQSSFEGVNLYVKNLDDAVTEESLKADFSVYGEISSVKVMTDSDGTNKGFGFVCFVSSDDAVKAVNGMNGKLVLGKPLYVAIAQRKEQRKAQLEAQHRRVVSMPPQMYPYGAPQMSHMGMPNQQLYNQPPIPQQMNPMMRQQQMMRDSQIQFTRQARNTVAMGKESMLSAEALAGASQSERKDMIGQQLYPKVAQVHPQFAAKITGMLLEMDNQELLHLLESPDALYRKVAEAIDVLNKATYREALMK